MKNKILVYVTTLILFSSCSIQKQATKKKTSTIDKKDFVSETFRTITEKFEGEELNTDILPVSQRQKDAFGNLKDFFEEQTKGNLKTTVYYKADGSATVKAKQIELTRTTKEAVKTEDNGTVETEVKEKEKLKEEKVSSTIFLWIAIGVLIAIIGIREYKRRIV